MFCNWEDDSNQETGKSGKVTTSHFLKKKYKRVFHLLLSLLLSMLLSLLLLLSCALRRQVLLL